MASGICYFTLTQILFSYTLILVDLVWEKLRIFYCNLVQSKSVEIIKWLELDIKSEK